MTAQAGVTEDHGFHQAHSGETHLEWKEVVRLVRSEDKALVER